MKTNNLIILRKATLVKFIPFILMILFTHSCTKLTEPPLETGNEPFTTEKCNDKEAFEMPNECLMINSQWNKGEIPLNEFSQCIFKTEQNGTTYYGWNWSWPNLPLPGYRFEQVKSYPHILYGINPFDKDRGTTTTQLPENINKLSMAQVDYTAVSSYTSSVNQYNLAFDIWITNSKTPGPENILSEIMIWEDRSLLIPMATPDKIIGEIVEKGITYDLYKYWQQEDNSQYGWWYLAFIPQNAGTYKNGVHSVNLLTFINYLLENDHISSENFLSNVSLGNEIILGGGYTQIHNFKVTIEKSVTPTSFFDDFSDASTLNTNWVLSGSPQPKWVSSAFGRSGLFDNMGDSWYTSVAYSKKQVGNANGFSMETEVYLDISNPAGCWVISGLGLTKESNPSPVPPGQDGDLPEGLSFCMTYEGGACWGTPDPQQYHAYFWVNLLAEDGTTDNPGSYDLNADSYINGWHKMKIVVGADRYVKFYCDGALIWSSTKKLSPSMMTNRNLVLGYRSSGSAGKTYHDWVKVTYP